MRSRFVALAATLVVGLLSLAVFGIIAGGRDRASGSGPGTISALDGWEVPSKPPGYVNPLEPTDPTSIAPTSTAPTVTNPVSRPLPRSVPGPADTTPAAPIPRTASTPPTTTPTRVVFFGWTGQIIGVGSGHCLDIPANDPFDGAPLQIAVCNTSSAQQWTFASDGTVRARGKCMDVAWGSTADGAAIQLLTCNGDAAQIFVLNDIGELVNPQSGKCVSVNGASTDYGAQLSIWSCNGGSHQRWRR